MLPLTLPSYFFAACQVVSQTLRRGHYERVLHGLLPTASVVVHQKRSAQGKEHLDSLPEHTTGVAFADDFVQLYSTLSFKEINVSSWMSYTASLIKQEDSGENEHQNVYVVVETRYAVDEEIRKTHPELRVHALSLGQPVAWKSSDHFDVIISCCLSGLVKMIDAFGQGRLHLDEDLQIKGFATIQLSGCPQVLYGKQSQEISTLSSQENSKRGIGTEKTQLKITKGSITSKLGIAQPVSSEKPQFQSSEVKNGGPSQISKSDPSAKTTHSPRDSNRQKPVKPPNILVYCGDGKDSAQTYASVRSSLEMCINTDVYIIYHLTHAEMLAAPWVDNTALLLLASSCGQLTSVVEQKIKDFVFKSNGLLLSFNTSVESAFAKKVTDPGRSPSELLTFDFDASHKITCLSGNSYYLSSSGDSETIISAAAVEVSEESSSSGKEVVAGTSDPQHKALVLKTSFDKGGAVAVSQLILERDPAHSSMDQSSFVTLKFSNTGRLLAFKHILASLGLDVSPRATPHLTPCCLLSRQADTRKKFLTAVHRKLDKESVLRSRTLSLAFLEGADLSEEVSPTLLPVITGENNATNLLTGFNEEDYWRHLQTSKLGQVVLYTDVIPSTMPMFEGMLFSLPHGLGPVAIAGRQTNGRGRGGNAWLSPLGCAMFTLPLSFDVDSEMGQRISFLQHLVSTSVVHSIRTLPGCQNLNLRLKWPNDIYYGKDMKLGGVIVTSTIMGSTIHATIGCGVNVANSDPTICINDIIQLQNRSRDPGTPIPLLSPAGVIARTLSTLEKLLADFEKHGHTGFCEVYYKYWLHGGVKVTLETKDEHGQGDIVGLDEYGFLSVRKPSGEVISVQPDGNSFDMMQNLLYCKRR